MNQGHDGPNPMHDDRVTFDSLEPAGVSGELVKGGLDLPRDKGERPTEPGFYYNDGAAGTMVFHLSAGGHWQVAFHHDSGPDDWLPCAWGYIEQTVGVYPLKKV